MRTQTCDVNKIFCEGARVPASVLLLVLLNLAHERTLIFDLFFKFDYNRDICFHFMKIVGLFQY